MHALKCFYIFIFLFLKIILYIKNKIYIKNVFLTTGAHRAPGPPPPRPALDFQEADPIPPPGPSLSNRRIGAQVAISSTTYRIKLIYLVPENPGFRPPRANSFEYWHLCIISIWSLDFRPFFKSFFTSEVLELFLCFYI